MDGLKRAHPRTCTCGPCKARDRALSRTLQNDKALDLFCETILRGRRERDLAIAQKQTLATAHPMICAAAMKMGNA